MKKRLSILLAIVMTFSISTVSFASTETTSILDGEVSPVYDSSSCTVEAPKNTNRAYSNAEQAKIDAAIKEAIKRKREADSHSGEMRVVGTLAGRPLYAVSDISIQTKGTTKKSMLG